MPLAIDGFKVCPQCNIKKPVSEFSKKRRTKDGLYAWCKPCDLAKQREGYRKRRAAGPIEVSVEHKVCQWCGATKPAGEFYRASFVGDGLSYGCKPCNKLQRRLYRQTMQAREPLVHKTGIKKCGKCQQEKPVAAFNRNRARYDHLDSQCKECSKQPHRERYLKTQYGIGVTEYDDLFSQQNGLCALCQRPESLVVLGRIARLAVDHNHVTGAARSLLCNRCNISVGGLEYLISNGLLKKTFAYLRSHRLRIQADERT